MLVLLPCQGNSTKQCSFKFCICDFHKCGHKIPQSSQTILSMNMCYRRSTSGVFSVRPRATVGLELSCAFVWSWETSRGGPEKHLYTCQHNTFTTYTVIILQIHMCQYHRHSGSWHCHLTSGLLEPSFPQPPPKHSKLPLLVSHLRQSTTWPPIPLWSSPPKLTCTLRPSSSISYYVPPPAHISTFIPTVPCLWNTHSSIQKHELITHILTTISALFSFK